jgi:beta-N-acetylhexosaminidase
MNVTGLAHRVLMPAFHGPSVPPWLITRLQEGLGSVCLFGSNLTGDDDQAAALVSQLRAASPAGFLVALDEEGGDVTRLDAARGSRTAGAAQLGAADDLALTTAVAAVLGQRLRQVGVDLDLGPVADVNCEPDNPVIGVRSFGASPELVAAHVVAFSEGLRAAGIASCIKHFPGHGATVEDSHVGLPRLDLPLETLRERELVPFAASVKAGVEAVMTSHVVVASVDSSHPATTSPAVIDILRSELGFDGVIVADALDMAGVAVPYGGAAAAAVAALNAGVDLLCLGTDDPSSRMDPIVASVVSAIVDAVAAGTLSAGRLEEAAGRVERLIASRRALPPAGPSLPLDPSRDAAERALRVSGSLPAVSHGAVVVEFDVTPGIAAGAVPWGLAGPLARRLPDVRRFGARPHEDSDWPRQLAAVLAEAARGGAVIAVVRDQHRHAWVREQLADLADARPDLVVVETGWPLPDAAGRPSGLPGALHVWTHGGSAVAFEALADLLARS